LKSGECCAVRELAVSGDDLIELGFKKGISIGETLEALLGHVIEHPWDNDRDMLLKLARKLLG
jgi:tRNA nucleotidyltransferase (CCA-adding enzyme)